MRYTPTKAELAFLSALTDGAPLQKLSVELTPAAAEALGTSTVPPETLDHLELESGAGAALEPAEEPPPDEQPVQVDEFDRADAEPVADEEDESVSPEQEKPSRSTHGKLFADKRAHPLQLFEVLNATYKKDWAGWEPNTLWWVLRRDFGPVGELTRNKIMALRLAAISDTPWLDWDIFENSGLAWNDLTPTFGVFQPMTPMQMAFAVQIFRGIRADEEFDTEVRAYVASILEDEGWVYAPDEYFGPVQALLDRKVWVADFKQQVAEAWERVKDVDPTTIDWNHDQALDIHLLKLAVVKYYLQEREALRQVLPGPSATTSTVAPPVP